MPIKNFALEKTVPFLYDADPAADYCLSSGRRVKGDGVENRRFYRRQVVVSRQLLLLSV